MFYSFSKIEFLNINKNVFKYLFKSGNHYAFSVSLSVLLRQLPVTLCDLQFRLLVYFPGCHPFWHFFRHFWFWRFRHQFFRFGIAFFCFGPTIRYSTKYWYNDVILLKLNLRILIGSGRSKFFLFLICFLCLKKSHCRALKCLQNSSLSSQQQLPCEHDRDFLDKYIVIKKCLFFKIVLSYLVFLSCNCGQYHIQTSYHDSVNIIFGK